MERNRVLISGLPGERVIARSDLMMYFQSKKKSGGGEVSSIDILEQGQAIVTFQNEVGRYILAQFPSLSSTSEVYLYTLLILHFYFYKIYSGFYSVSSKDLFSKLNWLNPAQRRKRLKATMMYKTMNNLTPRYLKDLFTYTSEIEIHDYNLYRNSDINLHLPLQRTESGRKGFSCSGAALWNALPKNARTATSL
jgi:hypothetical protein